MKRTTLAPLVLAACLVAGCTSTDAPASDTTPSSRPNGGSTAEADTDVGVAGDSAVGVPSESCPPGFVDGLSAWSDVGYAGSVVILRPGSDCRGSFGGMTVAGGPVSDVSVFSIGSVTKTMTAVAALQLVDSGTLSLDDAAGQWIEGLSPAVGEVTVAQLISHQSGLTNAHGDDFDPFTRQEAIEAIDARGLAFVPGTDELYSNSGYTLLAAIIEAASGQDFRQVMEQDVLTVDGQLLGSFWNGAHVDGQRAQGLLEGDEVGQIGDFDGPHWAIEGAGGVAMSPSALARWASALLEGSILTPDLVDVLIEADGGADGRLLTVGGGDETGHTVVLYLDTASTTAAAIATTSASPNAEDMIPVLLPSIEDNAPISFPASSNSDSIEIADVAGVYPVGDDGSRVEVSVVDGGVEVVPSAGAALQLMFPLPEGFDVTVAEHEDLTRAFAAGETDAGAEELNLLRDDLGLDQDADIASTVLGSAFVTPDLRTYFEYEFEGETLLVWVSLDSEGGLNGIDFEQPLPTRRLVAIAPNRFVPADSIAGDPTFVLTIADGELTVDQP